MRYLIPILMFVLFSCKKATPPSDSVVTCYFLPQKAAKLLLRDKATDSLLYALTLKYRADSAKLLFSGDNISFTPISPNRIYEREWPIGVMLDYTYQSTFKYYYAVKWNSSETDSLKVVKETEDEIQFYTNGKLYKTVTSGDEKIPEITFYR